MSEATQGAESIVSVTMEPRSAQTAVTLRNSGVPDDEKGVSTRRLGLDSVSAR